MGASLVEQRVTRGKSEVALAVALKLLAHPLVVWLLATHVFFLQPLWAKVAVTAANLFVLAQQYDLYVDRAPAVVFASTLISVVTVWTLLGLVVGQ